MEISELHNLLVELTTLNGENEWIEFKLNKMNPEEVGKWISALSNGSCLVDRRFGYLIFGVDDETKNIIGTKSFLKEQKKGKEEIEHWLVQRLNPRIDLKFYDFDFEGKKISLVKIPSAISQPVRFVNTAYIRVGSITRDLIQFPEKEKKIWRNESKIPFELQIAKEKIKKSDLTKYLSFRTYYDLMKSKSNPNLDVAIAKFIEESLLIKKGHFFSITNLGAILFANDLNHFDKLFRKSIRLISYASTNRLETEREFTGRKGYALAFSNLVDFLDALLPNNEIIERALRKEVKMYPTIALRELIANALIHQDFEIKGSGPMIEIFKDRLEITNPGIPIIDVLRFIDHSPQSRNEKLAFLMRRLNICEERGSGVDKVVAACEAYQLPAPEFIVGDNFLRVKIFSPRKLSKMDKKDKIRACYQHACLKYVSGENMTNSTLRTRFNIGQKNYPMASRIISDTINANLIKDSDRENKSRKHAKYVPFWA